VCGSPALHRVPASPVSAFGSEQDAPNTPSA
jgi:hypothetical protein